ncbi:MAG: putative spermidine/putrescine transport system permease componentof ATP-transporter system [Rhodobacteraceae bacterium]|nr:MAG: putative spermidine/putrescine transport system permease componentof ATP-transporter system [Paracoccaceae bacterium]
MIRNRAILGQIYFGLFVLYLLVPLVVMAGAAFNDSKLPTVAPWKGFTWRWFGDLWADQVMWGAFLNSILVALAVVAVAVPIGTAAAIVLNSISGKVRATLYGFMVAPVLAPGLVIGISTVLFWNQLGNTMGAPGTWPFGRGLHLATLGQVSYIAAYVMLLVLARLQSFDPGLEEAALDLGASHGQVLRRILLPHLFPAIAASAAIAFFQSIENFNVTLFTKANETTLTVYVFSQVRSGITPKINALAFLLILLTLVLALAYEANRRRKARIEAEREAEARRAEAAMLL